MFKIDAKVKELINKSKKEIKKKDSYSYLPEIILSLESLSKLIDAKDNEKILCTKRQNVASALERLITEDINFAESKLGKELLLFTESVIESKIT